MKRRKTSAASFLFFADSDDSSEDDGDVIVDAANPEDELKAYLNVPQIKYVTEQDMMNWWKDHQGEFPNVAVMARQYLGCPASSAAVLWRGCFIKWASHFLPSVRVRGQTHKKASCSQKLICRNLIQYYLFLGVSFLVCIHVVFSWRGARIFMTLLLFKR